VSFDRYFKAVSYMLVATACAALAMTGQLSAFAISLYALAMIASFYADMRGRELLRLSPWGWRLLALLFVIFFAADAAFLSSRIVALIHLTLLLSAAKLAQKKRDRDWAFLYAIGFFQMLLASGLTFDASFAASLGAFVFFLVSALSAFEIRRARSRVANPIWEEAFHKSNRGRPLWIKSDGGRPQVSQVKYLLGASALELVLVVALALPLFFLIPRSSGRGLASHFGEAMTGFSNEVRLGEIASLKESDRLVMRVRLDRDPGRPIRWRGIALDHFDGRAWHFDPYPEGFGRRREFPKIQEMRVPGRGLEGDFERDYRLAEATTQKLLRQEILLEPMRPSTLFAAYKPVRLRGPIPRLILQDTGAIYGDILTGRTAYTVWSDISSPDEEQLRAIGASPHPEPIRRLYLQLPKDKLDPRIWELARRITRGLTNDYDRARAIESYLKNNFGYTLDVKISGDDPLAEFLFEKKEGHCEYFASAMAVLLRSIGIPSRIVNGFQMGQYNELGRFYTVRQRDAHSWVEAYFAGLDAWVEFDPTPAAGINDYSRAGWLATLRKYLDAVEVLWLDYVVTLDQQQQALMLAALQEKLSSARRVLASRLRSARRQVIAALGRLLLDRNWGFSHLLALTLALLGATALLPLIRYYGAWYWRWLALPFWKKKNDPVGSAVVFYEETLRMLARAGVGKRPDQTPLEFAEASGLRPVREITELYNRVRFGRAPLSEADAWRVTQLLRELRQTIKRRPKTDRLQP
jgi:transglutaminase-like putative cysteine protease